MKRRTRTVIFIACLLLFFIVAPLCVLYSQGYRFDFQKMTVTKTGAIFFKVSPKSADIYVNGRLYKTNSLFSNSVLVENLLPKRYSLEVEENGYHTWKKTLNVTETQVTEVKYVDLFPLGITLDKVPLAQATTVEAVMNANIKKQTPDALNGLDFKDFSYSPDGKEIAYYTDNELQVLFLEDNYDLGKKAGDTSFLARFSDKIGKVYWLNNDYLIMSVGDKVMVTEIDDRDKPNITELFEMKNPNIYWDSNSQTLYVLSEGTLYQATKLLP